MRSDVSQKINQMIEQSMPIKNEADPLEALTPDQHVFKSLEIVSHMGGKAS